jgi:ribA/ribD-fused uncharacterized protein
MDNSSYFIKGKAMFGSFPAQSSVRELEQEGVRYFVDLTFPDEKKIVPYTTNYSYLRFSIPDCRAPRDWRDFAKLVVMVADIISTLGEDERVYIHCKGGHGRSGVVVACLLCHIFGFDPGAALQRTTNSHSKRSTMSDKWRKIGSPQTYPQKNFVHKFFGPLRFHRAFKHGHTAGFSTFTAHSVVVQGLGTFMMAEAAIQAHKAPNDTKYVRRLQVASSPTAIKELGKTVNVRSDWGDIEKDVVFSVLKMKFDQHPSLQVALLNTGLRRIIYCHPEYDRGPYGNNTLGKALVKLRDHYYRHNREGRL